MRNHIEERLRRHSAQQEALANLSSEALGGRTPTELASDAVRMIGGVLDLGGAAIWYVKRHGAVAIAAAHGAETITEEAARSRVDAGESFVGERDAVFVIAGSEGPAGLLAITSPRRLRIDEVHFLTAIANVMAQAIARGSQEKELRTRAAQQIAIAQFGRFALLGITQELLEHLCDVVQAILNVDYAMFLRYDGASNTFHRAAGRWWVGEGVLIAADDSTLSGYTTLHGGPVIVTDFATETRFASHVAFSEAGFVSGMAAEIRGERNLFGVILAPSRTRRQFTDTDARFLQSLANAAADAMERDAAQRALADSQEQLAKANRVASLGRLAATVAHEFNNVLMGISPFLELLKRADLAPERRLSAIDYMAKAIQRGRRITEEILRFTNQPEPVFEPVDLVQWSHAVAHEFRAVLGPQYPFRVEADDRMLRVRADAGQLHQMASNLVLNARDAMPGGGAITLSVRREEALAHLIVSDEGPGLAEEAKRHIFEPLFTTKRHGTGLGLAITHQIVQRHGGTISFESEPEKGTSFHIFLPLEEEAAPRGGAETAAEPARTRRILLVEDDVNVATGIALLLQEENFAVDVVNLGAEALEAVVRTSPDVVVLDLGLPDVEGTQIYEQIAAARPSLAVIFSTGHGDEKRLEPYLSRGNVAMLLKPYEIGVLISAIDRLTSV